MIGTMVLTEARQEYLLVASKYEEELAAYNSVLHSDADPEAAYAHACDEFDKLTDAYRRVFSAWREENPLRVARRRRGLAMHVVSVQARVSYPTIQSWENGSVNRPNTEAMLRVAQLFDDPTLPMQWARWRGQRPQIHLPSPPRLPMKIPGK